MEKEDWILSKIKIAQRKLSLSLWTIKIIRVRYIAPHDKKLDPDGASAEIKNIDQHYMCADIFLSDKFFRKLKSDEKQCEEDLTHELCHIYTDLTYDFAFDYLPEKKKDEFSMRNEQLTQIMSKLIR